MPEENIKSLPASALTAAGQLSPDPHPSSFNPSPTSAHGKTAKLPQNEACKTGIKCLSLGLHFREAIILYPFYR